MQRGDKWNWALVMSAITVISIHLFLLHYRIQAEDAGRHVHKLAYGVAGMFFPVYAAPVLLVFAGIAAAWLKSKTPLVGTALGIPLCYPMFVASFAAALLSPYLRVSAAALVFLLPAGVFVWGILRKPNRPRT